MRTLKTAYLLFLALLFITNCNSQNNTKKAMEEQLIDRKPYAAGRFYTNNPGELRKQVEQLFSEALPKKTKNPVLAVIAPHAGYVFSGVVAATSINQIDDNKEYNRIFIIGSSHTTSFNGASIYCKGNYIAPFGTVKVDIELANKLIDESDFIDCYPDAHLYEHSLEVELPLLQYKMKKDFRIVPIVIGTQNNETCQKIAKILAPYFNEENLFIISTDFSHYPDYDDACEVDLATANAIQMNSPAELLKTLRNNNTKEIPNLATSLCGWTSVLTLLYITEKLQNIEIDLLQYRNSGDSPYGEKDRVVGYNSIMFTKSSQIKTGEKSLEKNNFELNNEEKKYLLQLARNTIVEYIDNNKIPKIDKNELTDNIKANCGAFVTLHIDGKLRGCIGRFGESQPLYEVVQEMAISSATQDSRFARVTKEEIPSLDIEISVLTPLIKINSIDEFELGKHGIYIKKGMDSGTFLPQVANDTKWTKEEFLGHCARDKAGIGWFGWQDADLYTYEAIIFSEHELKK